MCDNDYLIFLMKLKIQQRMNKEKTTTKFKKLVAILKVLKKF